MLLQNIPLRYSLHSLIFGNFYISLSAITLTLSSYLINNYSFNTVSIHLLAFIFFSTFFIYNFNTVGGASSFLARNEKEKWIIDNENGLKIFLLLALLGITYFSFFLNFKSLLFVSHLGLLAFLYVFPWKFSLRRIPLMKIFILTYVWSSVSVILPVLFNDHSIGNNEILNFTERFIFILALAIPFDIRDYDKDLKSGVVTIPGLVGIANAIRISLFLILIFVMISFFNYGINFISLSRFLSGIIAAVLIFKSQEKKEDWYYMFWIDGIMIIHFILLTFAHYIIK